MTGICEKNIANRYYYRFYCTWNRSWFV